LPDEDQRWIFAETALSMWPKLRATQGSGGVRN
jgi:hypothetical protein